MFVSLLTTFKVSNTFEAAVKIVFEPNIKPCVPL